jgi:hypothetical protein
MGQGRAEEGHDPVAHHLVHGALVTMYRLHHVLEDGVEELARLLGIAVGQQLHGALEVGKEDGDLLSLALENALRAENLLREMPGMLGDLNFGSGRAAEVSRWPQRLQNLAAGWFDVPQLGPAAFKRAPHSSQNAASAGLSC